ncbi:hypothetical protein YC2023_107999 [Brassica napus]
MNWSRSWSKVCDSDRIVPSPSHSASGPWWLVGRSVMFLFDCWLAGWPFISNPWCGSRSGPKALDDPKSSTRPQVRWDHPLSLSISISGGKETNKDSLSNGERTGKSPA